MTSLTVDDLTSLLERCNMEAKTIKQAVKNKKIGPKFVKIAKAAGVHDSGCERTTTNLLYMIATKLKATHDVFTHQLAQAVVSNRLDSNQRVTEALRLVHSTNPDLPVTDKELDIACGVGLNITDDELAALVTSEVEKIRAELVEKRYTYNIGGLQRVCGVCDPRMKWANGKLIRDHLMRLQLEILGPKTDSDTEMMKASKGKGKGKKTKKDKGSDKKKGSSNANKQAAKGETKGGDNDSTTQNTTVDGSVFLDRARLPSTAYNTPEAIKKHKEETKGIIRTRFPPEPNGYLHIGHAKACNLNFEGAFNMLASTNNGVVPQHETYLRFDDTNPKAESKEYIDNIIENVKWLGWTPSKITHSSDHFQTLYDFGERLIQQGDAFVCDQTAAEMKESKDRRRECNTTKEALEKGRPLYESKWRNRPKEESMALFREMRDGKHDEGTYTLRLKMDWASPFPVMWDTVAYRIIKHPHPHTGDKWCIYPTYDYTHCLIDSLENIDYSLCTLEFEARRDSYYWLVDKLAPPLYKSLQFEFSRLNIEYAQLSKRRLKLLVDGNFVNGWDDPRLFTINGLRRRGYIPDGINNFCRDVGFSRNENVIEISRFEYHQRKSLNDMSRRGTAVTGATPIQIILTNWPKDKVEYKDMPNHPTDTSFGQRKLVLTNVVWISQDDFREQDSKNFFGLAPNKEVKLKYAYNIKCTKILEKDATTGNVCKLEATVDFENANKCKVLTWLSNNEKGEQPRTAEVRLYDHMFTCPVPGAKAKVIANARVEKRKKELMNGGKDGNAATIISNQEEDDFMKGKPAAWLADINTDSMSVTTHMFDSSIFEYAEKHFTTFQMERVGYYVVDPDSTKEHMILNRTLILRERKDMKNMKNEKKKKKGGGEGGKKSSSSSSGGAASVASNWTKTDIRVGHIVKAWPHPDSDKLWCEEIDIGEDQPRQIASGLRHFYKTVDQIQGRKCLVVANLKPAKLGGFKSEGMVLCAGNADHTQVEFVDVPEGAAIGERVFVSGESGDPSGPGAMKKKKIFAKLAEDLKTNSDKIATWQGKPMMTSAGPCTVPTLADVFIK